MAEREVGATPGPSQMGADDASEKCQGSGGLPTLPAQNSIRPSSCASSRRARFELPSHSPSLLAIWAQPGYGPIRPRRAPLLRSSDPPLPPTSPAEILQPAPGRHGSSRWKDPHMHAARVIYGLDAVFTLLTLGKSLTLSCGMLSYSENKCSSGRGSSSIWPLS